MLHSCTPIWQQWASKGSTLCVQNIDPSAAAASRRAEFLGMPPPNFFMAQPNPSRIFQTFQPAEYFAAQIRREHTAQYKQSRLH